MDYKEFTKTREVMKIRGIPINIHGATADYLRANNIRHHSTGDNETPKHFIIKCLLGKLLNSIHHIYYSEFEFSNKAQADIYDATDNLVYEVESRKNKEAASRKFFQYKAYARDLIIIYAEDYSDNWVELEAQLRQKLGLSYLKK